MMTKDEIKNKFTDALNRKSDIDFLYHGNDYVIVVNGRNKWCIAIAYKPETTKEFDTPDKLLESKIDGKRIIDICEEFEITDVS